MITIEEVLSIHAILIDKFGGGHGVRDVGLLESALNRPFATFDGIDLYPETLNKAAAVLESILINHPFIDGNKRTGYVMARLLLLNSNLDIYASQQEKFDFVIAICTGDIKFEEIINWLRNHVRPINT